MEDNQDHRLIPFFAVDRKHIWWEAEGHLQQAKRHLDVNITLKARIFLLASLRWHLQILPLLERVWVRAWRFPFFSRIQQLDLILYVY